MKSRNYLAGDMMMLAATMIFGAMTIFSKQILAELDVFNMVALRFLIAFAACFVIFIKRYRNLDRRTSVHAFILGHSCFSHTCAWWSDANTLQHPMPDS